MIDDAPKTPETPEPATSRFSLMARLRTYLITGILVTAPIAITISLI